MMNIKKKLILGITLFTVLLPLKSVEPEFVGVVTGGLVTAAFGLLNLTVMYRFSNGYSYHKNWLQTCPTNPYFLALDPNTQSFVHNHNQNQLHKYKQNLQYAQFNLIACVAAGIGLIYYSVNK